MYSYLKKLHKAKINQLSKNNIHIWKIDLDKIQLPIDIYLNLLTQEEKNHANKYRIINKRKSYIVTRATLKLLLYYYINNTTLFKNKYGKLYIKEDKLYFNISHTKNMSIIAFSKDDEIGIDLENIQCNNNLIDIATKYFTKREKFWIKTLPKNKQLKGFLYCWVRKEAYTKALGLGLNFPFDSFHVIPKKNQKIPNNYFQIKKWFLYPLEISTQYLGAICIKNSKIDIQYFDAHKFFLK